MRSSHDYDYCVVDPATVILTLLVPRYAVSVYAYITFSRTCQLANRRCVRAFFERVESCGCCNVILCDDSALRVTLLLDLHQTSRSGWESVHLRVLGRPFILATVLLNINDAQATPTIA